jgi:hypothetical protein
MFAIMPYGNRWRKNRAAMVKYIGTDASNFTKGHEVLNARRILALLLQEPENFLEHIKQ